MSTGCAIGPDGWCMRPAPALGSPLRAGVIGAGLIGERRAQVAAADPSSAVVAIADLDVDRARRVAERVGCAAVREWSEIVCMPGVDAVIVATSHDGLAPIAVAAARAGKHVLCEKPLGRDLGEARAIVCAARDAGVVLKTGFNHRHHPAIRAAHQRLPELGRVLFARCRYGHGGRAGYEQEWRGNAVSAGGGELLDQGIHVLDLFRWFVGEFVEVHGVMSTAFWQIAPLEDNAFAWLRTAAGQVASLHASWTQWRNLFSFEVYGEHGALAVEGLGGSYGTERLITTTRRPGELPLVEEESYPGPDRSWVEEWGEFTRAIRAGEVPLGDGYDGLAAMRLVDAIYRAARVGAAVGVEEHGDQSDGARGRSGHAA